MAVQCANTSRKFKVEDETSSLIDLFKLKTLRKVSHMKDAF